MEIHYDYANNTGNYPLMSIFVIFTYIYKDSHQWTTYSGWSVDVSNNYSTKCGLNYKLILMRYGDGKGNTVNIRFQDSTSQTIQFSFGQV
jgi:hypothetical protein